MRKFLRNSLVFIWILFQSEKGAAQSETRYDATSFVEKVLGSSLFSLKDSLRCVDGSFQMNPSLVKQCRGFEYVSPDKTIRTLSNNIFSTMTVSTDTAAIFEDVLAMTSYNKTGTPAYREQFEKDFEETLNYLRSIFKSRGKKGLYSKDRNNKQSYTQWKIDGFIFTLTKSDIKKKGKHDDFYIITFAVFKDKKLSN
jgi:hypothetical protein